MKNRVLLVIKTSDLNLANSLFEKIGIKNLFDIAYSKIGSSTSYEYISTVEFSLNVESIIKNNPDLFIKIVGYIGSIDLDPITKELGVSRIYPKR